MGQCWNISAWVFLRGAFNILQNEGVTLDSTMITGWNWRPPYMVTILSHCAGRWSQVHAGCKDNSHTAPNRQNICLRLLRMASACFKSLLSCSEKAPETRISDLSHSFLGPIDRCIPRECTGTVLCRTIWEDLNLWVENHTVGASSFCTCADSESADLLICFADKSWFSQKMTQISPLLFSIPWALPGQHLSCSTHAIQ